MFKAAKIHLGLGILTVLIASFSTETRGQRGVDDWAKAEELNGIAVKQISDKDYDAAIESLSKAIEFQPRFSQAHINLGTAHYLAGRPETAVGHIKKGLEVDPRSYKGYNQLGVAYDKMRKDDLAIEALKKAIELKPDYAFAYFNLGKAYLYGSRFKQSEAALRKGLQYDPANDDGRLHLATALAKQERYPEAIAAAKTVTRNQPGNDNANLILCQIYLLANDRESALGMYQSFKATNTSLADELFRSIFRGQTVDASPSARP